MIAGLITILFSEVVAPTTSLKRTVSLSFLTDQQRSTQLNSGNPLGQVGAGGAAVHQPKKPSLQPAYTCLIITY